MTITFGFITAGITVVTDPTPGTSPEDGTLNSQDVAGDGGHSRGTLDTAQPGVWLSTSSYSYIHNMCTILVMDVMRPHVVVSKYEWSITTC